MSLISERPNAPAPGNFLQRLAINFALASLMTCALAAGAAAQSRDARTPSQSQSEADATLTNAAVIKLVRAKFSDKMIVAIIRSRPVRFDLSPDRLIELKKGGASERVILAMIARGEEGQLAGAQGEGDPEDDAFFEGLGGSPRQRNAGAQPNQTDPNSVDIFGSSGGSRGRTQTNGINGGASGETQATGSATVRIIRPQEQNGAAKLERTPTLTNQSVLDLVEAGFSEGTIVRRIENSPAEFDLSPGKLAELRKRRVTEPVINAMRAAMDDAATPAPARHDNDR
jgi:hypothetical protein